jgi:DNA recombination protein RmuC
VQVEFLVIGIIIILGFIVIFYFVNKKLSELSEKTKPSEELLSIIKMLQEGSSADRRVLMDSLTKNTDSLNERLAQVQKNIGEMSEIGRGMKDLQDLLRSPKLRGNVGEHILKELLGQMLPKQSFNLQYSFKSGTIVDAAIKTTGGIIPVDSKFPMENFRKMMSAKNDDEKKFAEKDFVKDVKKHIDDISQKYILTDEGTIDYALMYIPSEAVYYEIVNNSALFDYSGEKRVLPVSPTTFYAYLKAILMSFEGQKIEDRAKQILSTIKAIQKDYIQVEESLGVLGRHLNNAHTQFDNVTDGFGKLGRKLDSTKTIEKQVIKEIKA